MFVLYLFSRSVGGRPRGEEGGVRQFRSGGKEEEEDSLLNAAKKDRERRSSKGGDDDDDDDYCMGATFKSSCDVTN